MLQVNQLVNTCFDPEPKKLLTHDMTGNVSEAAKKKTVSQRDGDI